jgi:YHS domain-containing protein/plastocyanin
MKRDIAYLILVAAGVALLGAPAHAHDVKDPVCRMMVDSDTTQFKHKLGGKTFYFCSKQCESRFAAAPEKYEKLAEQLETANARGYTVDLQTTPAQPMARQPVEMAVAIRYADDKTLVKSFEVVHEKFLHLLMVSEDLAWFEHQHPVRGEDGIFRLKWHFPRPGRYTLYADFTPADGDNQVLPLPLSVGGGRVKTLPLKPDTRYLKQVGDYRIELRLATLPGDLGPDLRMEKPAILTYTIRDRHGRLVRDMQPFIGAMGHLIAISRDGKEVVHTHVVQPAAPAMAAHSGLHVTPAMATATGPAFSFKLTLPSAGLYKTWAQFMHDNRVLTVPFTFQVDDIWGTTARAPARAAAARRETVQRATIVIDGQYKPAAVAVKPGKPVELTFVRKEGTGCGDVLQFPSLRLRRTLKAGEKTVVAFTPKKSGTIAFTCGMGMYRGQVIVR